MTAQVVIRDLDGNPLGAVPGLAPDGQPVTRVHAHEHDGSIAQSWPVFRLRDRPPCITVTPAQWERMQTCIDRLWTPGARP